MLIVSRGGPAAPSLRVPVPLMLDRQAATPVLRAMVLIGATPHTGWLPALIARDGHGFVVTGGDLAGTGNPAAS